MAKQSVLLLEAFGNVGEVIVDAIRAEGYRVAVATHRDIFDSYPERLRNKIDVPVFVDFASQNVRGDLTKAAREHAAAGVITGCEFLTALTGEVAADLGLPGNDLALASAARNKWHMAQVFHDAQVSHAATVHATSLKGLSHQIDANGLDYPIVVKPVENAGSVGVRVVNDPFELATAVKEAQAWPLEFPHGIPLDSSVIAQSYVGGQEYSVESLAAGGNIRHLTITEKITTRGNFRAETRHTVPARLDERARERLLGETTKALCALGFRNGAAHTEVKLWNGRPWIIESGLRPAGDHIVKLVTLATGVDFARSYVHVATGHDLPSVGPAQRHASVRFVIPERAGRVVSAPHFGPKPGVVESAVLVSEGDEIKGVANNVSRLAYIIATADNRDELDARLEAAVRNVRVIVE